MSTRPIPVRGAALLLPLLLATACRDELPTGPRAAGPPLPAWLPTAQAGMIDLGFGLSSEALGINASSHVVGWNFGGGWEHALLWTPATKARYLSPPVYGPSGASAINDAGTIVGRSAQRAFRRSSAGAWEYFGTTPSGAVAINSGGEIVGWEIANASFRAFLYRPGAGMVDLGMSGFQRSFAWDINDSSHIVGSFDTGTGSKGAFIMKSPGAMHIIAQGSGAATGLNNAGKVVGYTGDGSNARAFVWDTVEGVRYLPVLPPATGSVANDIDDTGRIVGSLRYSSWPFSGYAAVLWTPDGTGGYTAAFLAGALPSEAIAINNAGRIVGQSHPAHAVMWDIGTAEPPAAPTDVAGHVISGSRVDVSWTDAADNEPFFRVQRSTGSASGGFAEIGTVAAGVTSYADTTVRPGGVYRYRVQACILALCVNSAEVEVAVPFPSAPSGVAARAVSAVRVHVRWTDTDPYQNAFRVRRSARLPDGTFPPSQTIGEGLLTAEFTDTAAVAGATYAYVVQACSRTVCANSAPAVVPVPLRPAAPAGLSARTVSGRRIDLAWTDAATNEHTYLVRRTTRRPDGTYPPYQTIATLRAGSTAYADLAVEIGRVYHYRVAACNVTGCAFSDLPSSGVAVARDPAAPTGVVARAVSAKRVDVGWMDASTNETSFTVQRSTRRADGTFPPFQTVGTVGAGVTAFADATVAGGSTYRYRVQACRNATCTPSASVPVTVPGT